MRINELNEVTQLKESDMMVVDTEAGTKKIQYKNIDNSVNTIKNSIIISEICLNTDSPIEVPAKSSKLGLSFTTKVGEGYTVIGIAGWYLSGNCSDYCYISKLKTDKQGNIEAAICNSHDSVTASVLLKVNYVLLKY